MNRFISKIFGYVTFFLGLLGLTYLFNELWEWFQGDDLIRNAVASTITFILIDLCRLLFVKISKMQ